HVSTAFIASTLPTDGLSLVLFIQPLLQRSEIIQDRRRVHLLLPGQSLERLRPGLALAHGQHRVEPVPRRLAFVYGAAIQRSRASSGFRERTMKLELQNIRQEVARVRRVR